MRKYKNRTVTLYFFFQINNMYTFLDEKRYTFKQILFSTFLKIFTVDQYSLKQA